VSHGEIKFTSVYSFVCVQLKYMEKRSSAVAERPRDCVCRWNLETQLMGHLGVTQGHWKWHDSIRLTINPPLCK